MRPPLELKKTLNLPKTDFSMKANLPQNEPKWLERWEKIERDLPQAKAEYEKKLEDWKAAADKAKAEDKPPPNRPQDPEAQLRGNQRPANMTLKQFISVGLQLCSHLSMHHSIEEAHIFPVLARKMPEFRAGRNAAETRRNRLDTGRRPRHPTLIGVHALAPRLNAGAGGDAVGADVDCGGQGAAAVEGDGVRAFMDSLAVDLEEMNVEDFQAKWNIPA